MNLNVKVEGEEEQTLQYVNRFAINIPSSGAAFNLNVVNSGLSNQSYILNPVSPVAQNIVTYQQPMTLQSFIALPTEPDGNIIHGLPVGVSVPIGIPVTTGLLQNHNYVNTGIIIGNEDCNSPGVLKSASDSVTSEDDLKITYVQKPLEDLTATITNADTIEPHDIGLNCSSQVSSEIDVKKTCPLEMSIKAANIDVESGSMVTVVLEDRSLEVEGQQLVDENMTFRELKDDGLEVPLELASTEKPNGQVLSENSEIKKQKTEITWENNNIKDQENNNDFQESLICEVEEVNDDEDEEVEEEERTVDGDVESEPDGVEEDEEAAEEEDEVESMSLNENDTSPLTVTLKLRKRTNSRKNKNDCHKKRNTRSGGGNVISNKWSDQNKVVNKRSQRLKQSLEASNCDSEWSESDDDVLNLKRIKNEFNYKCFYETKTTRSTNSSLSKIDDKCKKFVRVRSCCSKLECAKKISAKEQKGAHKMFYELESEVKRDAYLMNCIEHVQKTRCEKGKVKERSSIGEGKWDSDTRKPFLTTNIQLEIENESNGNQKLSDEIQNAINESLKDCIANENGNELNTLNEVDDSDEEKNRNWEKAEKNNWNFYIVIDRCRKRVCLQFLLKLFRINKTRIKNLQKNILFGTPLAEDSNLVKSNQKGSELREIVKTHLDSLATEECLDCSANPHHRFLTDWCTREYLFDHFKEFYSMKVGKEPKIKYTSYKRLLSNETVLSFLKKKDGVCAECEDLRKRQKRKLSKVAKEKSKCKKPQSNTDSSVKSRKLPSGSNSDEDSSDDEPLAKHRKSKLSPPNHGGSNANKSQRENSSKRNSKNSTEKKSRGKLGKEKSKQSTSRGRDVWSLMLLHLETMPYKESAKCVNKRKHRFLDPTLTTQGLFEDYRKYFLKETNSELGLGFTMYEKYFLRNCNYTIMEVDVNASKCPRCALEASKC